MAQTRVRNEAVEVIAAWHCNIRCESCAFASPLHSTRFADVDTVGADLSALAEWLEVEHVRILGGEPLLHPEFDALVERIRRSGVGRRIRVVTNGVPLLKMPDSYWEILDEIHVSRYPNTRRFVERHLEMFKAKCDAAGAELTVKHYDYFRYSFRRRDEDRDLTQRVFATCQMAHLWRSLTADNGRLYRCLQSAYIQDDPQFDDLLSRHGEDFLSIHDIASTDELETWLARKPALNSCSVCTGSAGAPHEQRQLKPGAVDARRSACEAIDFEYLQALERSLHDDNGCVTDILEHAGSK